MMLIERDIGPFNPRRYGRPWGAHVTFNGVRLVYNFKAASFLGDASGGTVFIEAAPGGVVAVGQRDLRGSNTEHSLFVVQQDGSLQRTTPAAALRHLRAAAGAR